MVNQRLCLFSFYFKANIFNSNLQDVTVTNDGATILKLLEVEHPAAKVLCELADLQDQEVGDGTTSVVILAAELLKNAEDLVKSKIHPTSIISGYRLACKLVLYVVVAVNKLLYLIVKNHFSNTMLVFIDMLM